MAASYRVQYANFGCRTRAWYRPACSQERGKIVLKGIVSQNQSALFRKTNNLTKRGIMSASSIWEGHPPGGPSATCRAEYLCPKLPNIAVRIVLPKNLICIVNCWICVE